MYWHNYVKWGLLLAGLYCLITSPTFTAYPNLLNFSPNPIIDIRTAYRVDSNVARNFHVDLAHFPKCINFRPIP